MEENIYEVGTHTLKAVRYDSGRVKNWECTNCNKQFRARHNAKILTCGPVCYCCKRRDVFVSWLGDACDDCEELCSVAKCRISGKVTPNYDTDLN